MRLPGKFRLAGRERCEDAIVCGQIHCNAIKRRAAGRVGSRRVAIRHAHDPAIARVRPLRTKAEQHIPTKGVEVDERAEGQITALVVNGKRVDEAKAGEDAAIIVNQTPFYGESGGQVGDTGVITSMSTGTADAVFTLTDVQKKVNGVFVHLGRVDEGAFKVGDEVRLEVDGVRRGNVRANHSATHLLHAALRSRLGDHVTQKGSLVASDRLRFDISHPKALEPDDLAAAEEAVNRQIVLNTEVVTHLMDPDAAVEAGAMALFGEKYGDEVRVVSMGGDGDDAFSTELCGGTHVRNTGDIEIFKILSESAVAAGVRRIEALTGAGVRAYLAGAEQLLSDTRVLLDVDP